MAALTNRYTTYQQLLPSNNEWGKIRTHVLCINRMHFTIHPWPTLLYWCHYPFVPRKVKKRRNKCISWVSNLKLKRTPCLKCNRVTPRSNQCRYLPTFVLILKLVLQRHDKKFILMCTGYFRYMILEHSYLWGWWKSSICFRLTAAILWRTQKHLYNMPFLIFTKSYIAYDIVIIWIYD